MSGVDPSSALNQGRLIEGVAAIQYSGCATISFDIVGGADVMVPRPMSTIFFELEIEALPGAKAPDELADAVWDAAEERIWKVVGERREAAPILEREYLEQARYGYSKPSATALPFVFPQLAGCCSGSAAVFYHWMELAIAIDWKKISEQLLPRYGYRTRNAPRPLVEQAWMPSDTFAAFGTPTLYLLYAGTHGYDISFDNNDPLRWDDLSATDQRRVQVVALTRDCRCPFCLGLKERGARFPKLVDESQDPAPLIRAMELMQGDGQALREQAQAALLALGSWADLKPPDEVAVLADWLEDRGARVEPRPLIGMTVNQDLWR